MKILGTTYLCGAVVRVHTPVQLGTTDPFVYCQIQEVYGYNDHKIFLTNVVQILSYEEHFKAVKVVITEQPLLCHVNELYCHGVLHLKPKGNDLYIVERDNRGMSCPFSP